MWPSRAQVDKRMPLSFQDKFPKCRCIIDCTEIVCEVPQSLIDSTSMHSHYKGRVILKAMLGIEPAGGNTFISQLYPGSTSDREIVLRSGFLNPALWTPGDVILADKWFTIQDLFQALGVVVNIPTFLRDRQQMETHEVVYTQQIANNHIHVERAIQRVKSFQILNGVVPMTLFGSINQIWSVCCMLANFQDPIITQ